ncbi:MAG: BrnT family toxin [Pseudomonadota bacterium]
MYEWNSAQAEANKAKHGVEFETAEGFDWTSALILDDEKHSDKERRYCAVGFIGDRLHVMIWTPRGATIRLISLRKANAREAKLYEKTAQTPRPHR